MRSTIASNGIDFVNEDDAGAVALGLFKEVTHAACAYTHKHFDELGAGNAKEGDTGLTRNGLRHQGLACAGRANQQDALGGAPPKAANFCGFLRNSTISCDSCLASSEPATSAKVTVGLSPVKRPATFAKGEGLVVAALALAEEYEESAGNKDQRQQVNKERHQLLLLLGSHR